MSPKRAPDGQGAASALLRSAIVWDNHACMPLRPLDDSFLPQLQRHKEAGFDVVVLNVGFGSQGVDDHLRMIAAMRRWLLARPGDYVLLEAASDVERARESGRLAVGFDIEGANAIGDQPSLVQLYYDLGVRWMLLAYNHNNAVGGGCQDADGGLTDFGRVVIAEMERVGMLVCLSHTGHRTARDVLAMATQPVIFSHSNCAALRAHPRNISDDLIRACAATGGVVGINGVGAFLGENDDISSAAFARHVDHVVQLVGAEHVSIALDYVFDIEELKAFMRTVQDTFPPELGYGPHQRFVPPEQIEQIVETLQRLGHRDDDLRLLLGGNLMRLARTVWKTPRSPGKDAN